MNDTWFLFLGFTAGLLFIGLYALLTMRNMIKLFIGFEVVSKGVSLALLGTGFAKGNILLAQSLVITFIVVEVSLVATALAIIVNVTKHTQSLDIRNLAKLKG
jgi:multisubunit Na+/H+ antiporter MnhC subunit